MTNSRASISLTAAVFLILAFSAPVFSAPSTFTDADLPRRLAEKPKYREVADKALADWVSKNLDQSMEDAKTLAQSAKPKREEIDELTRAAEAALAAGDRDRAAVLHIIAYQALKAGGRATADEAIARLYKIAFIIANAKTTEVDRQFASNLLEQGLQTRRIAGGLLPTDAPYLQLHARLEFSLKHWETARKDYEFWLGMFESKGKDPPANEWPDSLGELGIIYTNQKNIPKAEEYFRRACQACLKLNGTTVTPVNQYDVEDFLIFNLLTQGKLDHAKELAQKHLKFKEETLGLRNPKLADELNRYADLFEQAGETAFSFSLRARAGRVTGP